MLFFKLGYENIRRNPVMHILVILQMSVVFLILISMVSTVVSRFKLYMPFSDEFNSKGYYYRFDAPFNPETEMPVEYKDDFCGLIEDEKEVILSYRPWFTTNYETSIYVSYDKEMIEKFTPELEKGSWIDTGRQDNGTVQVVVSHNPYNYKVGDIITVSCLDWYEVKAEIVGILKENTPIVDYSVPQVGIVDYRNIYSNYNYEVEEKTLFIFYQNELSDMGISSILNASAFVTYSDDVSDEVINNNNNIIKRLGVGVSVPLSEMKENSLKYIFSQLYDLMPVFVCVLILTLVGALSTSVLSAKSQLKNSAVYYICGLKWKQCTIANFWSSFICTGISFVLGLAAAFFIKTTGMFGETVIEFGIWQFLGCLAVVFTYLCLYLDGSIPHKIFASVYSLLILAISSLAIISISPMIFNRPHSGMIMRNDWQRFVTVLLVQLVLLYITYISLNLLKGKRSKAPRFSNMELFSITLILLMSIMIDDLLLTVTLNDTSGSNRAIIAVGIVCLVIINIVVMLIIVDLKNKNNSLMETEKLKLQLKYNRQYVENAEIEYEFIRKLRHDTKNIYDMLGGLLRNGEIKKAEEYIKKVTNIADERETFIKTENGAVNSVINTRLAMAKSFGISVTCFSVDNFEGIDDIDLCRLLSNMIENAVTATSNNRIAEKEIILRITGELGQYIFLVKNSTDEPVLQKNPNLLTTKKEKDTHGYGTKIIRDIAKSYHGKCDFFDEDNMFCCLVVLNPKLNT